MESILFSSDEIVRQLQQGTLSRESLETVFQARATKTVNGFIIKPARDTISLVRVNVDTEQKAEHQKIELLEITFNTTSTVKLTQVQPASCKEWKSMTVRGSQSAYRYLCIIGSDTPAQVNLLAGMTHALDDPQTHLESLSFVR